jgi:hypothetical protein
MFLSRTLLLVWTQPFATRYRPTTDIQSTLSLFVPQPPEPCSCGERTPSGFALSTHGRRTVLKSLRRAVGVIRKRVPQIQKEAPAKLQSALDKGFTA